MQIITLNTWGGRAGWSLLKEFFNKYQDADIFCLQEIWQTQDETLIENRDPRIILNLLEKIASVLVDHQYYFRPQYRGIYGLATFVKKNIKVETEGELFVFKQQGYENPLSMGNHARNIQYIKLKKDTELLTVVNFHGLWNGQGKGDSEDRLWQSRLIADFFKTISSPYLLVGDFNLNPDTLSFLKLKEACPVDLIAEYQVNSTRSKFYEKPGKFADYILACEKTKIRQFKVLPDEVSDHLGLMINLKL